MSTLNNTEEETLAQVGPGTPSGELFRRYWIPVEASSNLAIGDAPNSLNGPKNPIRVQVLGEELVLWRDGDGQPHLIGEHCAHRGTSLFYGRVEDACIRCPYHAWAFDGAGNCVDQPAEPPASKFKHTIRQPSYPCVEVAGLIFAYMGPPTKVPQFPRYDVLYREDGLRVTGDASYVQGCNVFQALHDNNLDVWHPEFAHNWFREEPAVQRMHHGEDGREPTPIRYDRTPWGTRVMVLKDTEEPDVFEYYELHTVWPAARCNRNALRWAVPIDDFRTRWFVVEFFAFGPDGQATEDYNEAVARQSSPVPTLGRADLPLGWENQVAGWWDFSNPWRSGVLWEDEIICGTQGSKDRSGLPDWERWNLASSDRGVLLNRRVWREQVERVRQGLDPLGVTRGPADTESLVTIPAGRVVTDWNDGVRLLEMSVDARLEEMSRAGSLASGERVRRV